MHPRTKIFVSGVGGQGSITATLVIGEAAAAAGLNVVSSEIHGMAQRGGIVETTVLIGDVHGAMIGDGDADVLLGFEPVETLRFIRKISPQKSVVLMNTHPIIPISVSLGRESYPQLADIQSQLTRAARDLVAFDAVQLATQAGSAKAAGTVMVGALAGLEILAIKKTIWQETLLSQVPKKLKDANAEAFEAGYRITANRKSYPEQ